jgi:type II secretory pathway pseudopilin PulG
MKKRSGDDGSDYDFSPSTILTSRYGHESRRLIHLIEKNLLIIMAIIVATVILSILNILGVLESFGVHEVDYIVDITLAVILVAVLVPLIMLILKSRRTLDRWSEMFERNTIATTMSIAMNNRSKEEALRALSQSVRQISEPLQEYMNSKGKDWAQFLNVSVDGNLVFDVLLDSNRVKDNNSNDNTTSNNLRGVLKEYGAIIIKIVDGHVDRQAVDLFTDSLSRYNAITNNQIGLGLIIGENVTEDTRQYYAIEHRGGKKRGGKIDLLVVMAKPSSTTFPSPTQEPEQTSSP